MLRDDHLFRCFGVPPLLMASRLPNKGESVSFQNGRYLDGGKAGVPRSPNRNLDQLRISREFDVRRCEVEFDGLFDVLFRLVLRIACRRTSGQLRADRGESLSVCVVFKHNAERHAFIIVAEGHFGIGKRFHLAALASRGSAAPFQDTPFAEITSDLSRRSAPRRTEKLWLGRG